MNLLLPLGIVGVLTVAGAVGYASGAFHPFFEGAEITFSSGASNCAALELKSFSPTEQAGANGIVRFHLNNEGDPISATLCLLDQDGQKRWQQSVELPAAKVTIVDVRAPTAAYRAVADFDGGAPDRSSSGSSTVDLRICASRSAQLDITVAYEADGSSETRAGGDCIPRPEGADAAQEQAARQFGVGPDVTDWGGSGPGLIGIGLGVGAATAAIVYWPNLKAAFFVLFTRLSRPRVLDHRVRGRIADLVAVEPGIHASAIARRLEIADGQAAYHLHVLVRERVLSQVGTPGFRRFFPAGRYAPQQMRVLAALRSRSLRSLYQEILAHPDQSLSVAAQRLGLSRPRVSHLVRTLVDHGLVERMPAGREVRLRARPTPMVLAV